MLLSEVLDPALFFRDEVCQDVFQILYKVKGKKVSFQLKDQAQIYQLSCTYIIEDNAF